jgi:hypothetical protein
VETITRELDRRDIVPDFARPRGLGKQVSEQVAKLSLCSSDMLASMNECGSSVSWRS